MALFRTAAILALVSPRCLAVEALLKGELYPKSSAIDTEYQLHLTTPWTDSSTISLINERNVATLDYGTELAGYPFLDVIKLSEQPVQLEVKYAEQFPALEAPFSDGPWTFQAGTGTNSFRVETFSITDTGRLQSYFVQGGQRWQSLRLITNGSVTLKPGFRLTSVHVEPGLLPGRFGSSNSVYNDVYDLGGRAVQAACIDEGASPAVWEITPEGALIRGQSTAQSAVGVDFANYTLSFSTKIIRGGTGFRVAAGIAPYGSYFVLTSKYPEDTFVNTNDTLLPANHLTYGYAWGFVNQSTLPVPAAQYFPLNVSIEENRWYDIGITPTAAGYNVTLDGAPLAFVPIAVAAANAGSSSFGSNSATSGTWGFGPFQDQVALFKDVEVTAQNRTVLYKNAMTSPDVLTEYGVAANEHAVCLDGAKRDRLVWIGDFVHTARTVLATTYRTDQLRGTIEQALEWGATDSPYTGFAGMSSALGARPENKVAYGFAAFDLIDYQDLFLIAVGDYYRLTGDLSFVQKHWDELKTLVTSRLGFNDGTTGLTELSSDGSYFLGSFAFNSTGVSAANAVALQSLVPIARALNDKSTAMAYSAYAAKIGSSLDTLFWNSSLGTYPVAASSPSDFDIVTIAFTIRAGFVNATQAASMLSTLSELRLGIGYKTGTYIASSNSTNLSPFIQGFLLEAIFIAHQTYGTSLEPAQVLLDSFWPAMVNQNEFYSGASWEYTYPDGTPGLDLFTSLSHPWGSAPTYILPEYVLGVSATSPGFKTWQFRPLLHGLGLTASNGTVQTPAGPIDASWTLQDTIVSLDILAPMGTTGQILLPGNQTFSVIGGKHTKLKVRV